MTTKDTEYRGVLIRESFQTYMKNNSIYDAISHPCKKYPVKFLVATKMETSCTIPIFYQINLNGKDIIGILSSTEFAEIITESNLELGKTQN